MSLSITRTYSANNVLTEAQLDAAFDSIETKFNSTLILGSEIGSGTITATNLATDAVEAAKILAGAVTAPKLDATAYSPLAGPINYALTATAEAVGHTLTIALKAADGTDPSATNPVKIPFRSATATTGTYTVRSATTATSVVIPNTATLAHKSARNCAIYVYALDNAGAVELAVISVTLDEGQLVSSTAISATADLAHVLYSTTARTGVACRYLGTVNSTQATAGVWDTAPSLVSIMPRPGMDYSILDFNWSTLTNPTTDVATSPSDGVQTITFPQIGRYVITAKHRNTHSAPYSLEVTSWTIGGTATRRDILDLAATAGEAVSDANDANTHRFDFEATAAGQTATIVPVYYVSYASTSHNMFSGYTVERAR